jgi:hypothetical protein
MSQLVKHLKVSAIADGPDPNQVNPSDWNASHVFSGGALGGLLMRDTGDATYGASWIASVAAGSVLISNGVGAAPTWAASLTLGGNLTVAGLVTVNGFGQHQFTAAGTGSNGLNVRNTTAGPTNDARVVIGNDANAALTTLIAYSSTFTSTGPFVANGSLLYCAGPGGLSLVAADGAGAMRFYTGGTGERMRITAAGDVVVNGTVAATNTLVSVLADQSVRAVGLAIQNLNAGNGLYYMFFINSALGAAGSIQQTGASTVAYTTTSDVRLKTDDGIAVDLSALRAVVVHDFTWTADGRPDRGVFAQDTIDVFPRAITEGSDLTSDAGQLMNPWGADYSKFVPDLIVGWQQHEARLAALETGRR